MHEAAVYLDFLTRGIVAMLVAMSGVANQLIFECAIVGYILHCDVRY